MPKPEKHLLHFLTRYRFPILLCLLALASVVLRHLFMGYLSSDMTEFLLPWINDIQAAGGGLAALANPIGNYNIAYLMLLVLANALPLDPVVTIKLYSILADYGMAVVVALIVYRMRQRAGVSDAIAERWSWVAAALTTLLPLPIINSALWGQCDSIYTLFLLLTVYFALRERWLLTFLMFGLAVAFKLQAVFLLPFLLILYVSSRRFSLLWFLTIPLPLWLSSLPAALQMNNLLYAVDIYKGQMEGDDRLFNDYFNLSVMFNNLDPAYLKKYLIYAAMLACLCLFALVWGANRRLEGEDLILLAGWSVMTCVMLLPNMHERYAYAGEMLLWVWFIARPTVKRLLPVAVFTFTGMAAYLSFLGGYWVYDVNNFSLLNLAAYGLLTYWLVRAVLQSPRHNLIIPRKEGRI